MYRFRSVPSGPYLIPSLDVTSDLRVQKRSLLIVMRHSARRYGVDARKHLAECPFPISTGCSQPSKIRPLPRDVMAMLLKRENGTHWNKIKELNGDNIFSCHS